MFRQTRTTRDAVTRHATSAPISARPRRAALLAAAAFALAACSDPSGPPTPARADKLSPLIGTNTASDTCQLDYMRADNAWAAFGRPDGFLGTETVRVPVGQAKTFNPDWRFEKLRNDGVNYYGSHLRVATNTGPRYLRVFLRGAFGSTWDVILQPAERREFRDDLLSVGCPLPIVRPPRDEPDCGPWAC
jgi:hypothetical protein